MDYRAGGAGCAAGALALGPDILVSPGLVLGYIAGHLFWGTGYIPDQKGDSTKSD